ncbi:MAG: hypothetical protein WBB07_06105, partial [Mycobacterium sp.]
PGALVSGAALLLLHRLRSRPRWHRAVTLGGVSGGLILAGAVLSRNPWRSVDGYAGFSSGVQLLALISVALLAASVVRFTNHSAHEDRGDTGHRSAD